MGNGVFIKGKRIKHSSYGAGTIIAASDDTISIQFDAGPQKKIRTSIAVQKGLIELYEDDEPEKGSDIQGNYPEEGSLEDLFHSSQPTGNRNKRTVPKHEEIDIRSGHNLLVSISGDETSFSGDGAGQTGAVIYISIQNNSSVSADVEIENEMLITELSEQKSSDAHLTAYDFERGIIMPGNTCKRGNCYYGKKIVPGWIYCTKINDHTHHEKYDLMFRHENNKWNAIKYTVSEDQETYLKKNIEKIDQFEEQLGIAISNITVQIDYRVEINYEVTSLKGKLDDDLKINIIAYGESNEILSKNTEHIDGASFMGFDTFSTQLSADPKQIKKIRIYPTKN